MKIAIVTRDALPVPSIRGGAVEVLSQYIVDGFLENGDYVDIYTVKDEDLKEYHERLKIFQISYGKLEFFIYRCFNYIFKLLKIYSRKLPYNMKIAKEISKHEYDYIVVENDIVLHENIYRKYHKKNKNTKFISHIHYILQLENDKLRQKISQFICDTSHKVIFVSDFIRKDALKYIDCEKNSEILYNCVDFEVFNKENKDLLLREKLGIKEDEFVYIFTGRMVEEKGIYELVKAFNLLKQEIDNIKLVIIGSKIYGEENKDEFYRKLKNESASDNVVFTGSVMAKNVAKYLNMADVVVIPTKIEEAFGVVALEAMATQKPIIATKSGGMVEVLNEDSSIIIEKDEKMIDNLYDAMKKMYFDKDFREKCAEDAYKRVREIEDFDKKYYFENFVKRINYWGEKYE